MAKRKSSSEDDIEINVKSNIETATKGTDNVDKLCDSLANIVVLLGYAEAQMDSFFNNVGDLSSSVVSKNFDTINAKIKELKKQTDYLKGASTGASTGKTTGTSGTTFASQVNGSNTKSSKTEQLNQLILNLQNLVDTIGKTTDGRDSLKQVGEALVEALKADTAAKKLRPESIKAETRFRNAAAIQKEEDNRTGGQTTRNAQRKLELKMQQAFYQALNDKYGNDKSAFFDLKLQARTANYRRSLISLEDAERRRNRRLYQYGGLDGAARDMFMRLEDRYAYRGGFVGMFSRLGGNIANNTKFGKAFLSDKFNKGVAGAGVNMGAVAFGALAVAVTKATESIMKFSKASIEAYAEIDKVKANLSVVYGGRLGADRIFNDIAEYAIKSPFSVSQTAQQAVLLKQTGVEEADVMRTLKVFGDLAGGKQEVFNHLIENYSKIMANQVITARNMQQFTMAGVPIYKALADQLGIRTSEVRQKVSAREVTADDVFKALEKLTEKGGVFYNAVNIGAKTYAARNVNLQDTFQLTQAAAAEWQGGLLNTWLSMKEDVATSLRSFFEGRLGEEKLNSATNIATKIDAIDRKIEEAKTLGKSEAYIQKLRVEKMEVESFSPLGSGEYKSVLSKEYSKNMNIAFGEHLSDEELRKLLGEYAELRYEQNAVYKIAERFFTREDTSEQQFRINQLKNILSENGVSDKTLAKVGGGASVNLNRGLYSNPLSAIAQFLIGSQADGKKFDPSVLWAYTDTYKKAYKNWALYGFQTEDSGAYNIEKNAPGNALSRYLEESSSYISPSNGELSVQIGGRTVIIPGNESVSRNFTRGYYDKDGKFVSGYTVHEKAFYEGEAEKYSEEAAGYLRKKGSAKNSTTSLLASFDKYYKTTMDYKEDEETKTKEMIQTLKDIYDEMKGFEMSPDNKFGFMKTKGEVIIDENGNAVQTYNDRFLRADEINKFIEKFFDTENATGLKWDEESFDNSIKTFRENMDGIGKNIRSIAISATGDENLGKQLEEWSKKAYNAQNFTVAGEAITNLSSLAAASGNEALQAYVKTLISSADLVEIDRDALDAEKKKREAKAIYDTALTPLIRDLTDRFLGVSLTRTIGADLGATADLASFDTVKTVTGYAKNNFERNVIGAAANALISQVGKDRISWKDVSSLVTQADSSIYDASFVRHYNPVTGGYDFKTNKKGNFATGRYYKGFIDVGDTRQNIENYTLANGSAASVKAISNQYKEMENNLNKFFAETMSSKEMKDISTKYFEVEHEYEALINTYGANYKETASDTVKNVIDNVKDKLDMLSETSSADTLGIYSNKEYRNSVVALTHQLIDAADGTKKYSEAYLEALYMFNEEIHERGLLVEAISNFREATENATNEINKNILGIYDIGYSRTNGGKRINGTDVTTTVISNFLTNKNNEELFTKAFGDKPIQQIFKEILGGLSTASDGYTLIEYDQDKQFNDSLSFEKAVVPFSEFSNLYLKEHEKELLQYGYNPNKDYQYYSQDEINYNNKVGLNFKGKIYGRINDFASTEEADRARWEIYKEYQAAWDEQHKKELKELDLKSAVIGSLNRQIEDQYKLLKSQNTLLFQQNKDKLLGESRRDGISLIGGYTKTYSGNSAQQQLILDNYGIEKGASFRDIIRDSYVDNGMLSQMAVQTLLIDSKNAGIKTPNLKSVQELVGLSKLSEEVYASIIAPAEQELGHDNVMSMARDKYLLPDGRPNIEAITKASEEALSRGDTNNPFTQFLTQDPVAFMAAISSPMSDSTLFNMATAYNKSYYLNDDGTLNPLSMENLAGRRTDLGLSNDKLFDLDSISESEESLSSLYNLINKVDAALDNLSKSMMAAFDNAIVDGISNSMVTLGESMRDGVDATDSINKGLRETFTNLLKSLGPQMTQTGLAIAAGAASKAGGPDWGRVMGGLGLAAAGGFLSWSGGLLSEPDKSKDEEAQKEARLKSLADLLSDLIAQARTDAEYYERNMRHERAISADYGISSRSVNDMILTPNGTFSTHPDDYLIATKNPYALSTSGSPNVSITIVNQSGDVVKVASTTKKEKDNGDIDIQAVIVAVTADAIASGEMDGAFAQREARRNGVTRMY